VESYSFAAVPVPTLEKKILGSGSGSRQYSALFFNKKKFLKNLAFAIPEAALFPRHLASHFWIFVFYIPFYAGSGSTSGSGTGFGTVMHSGSAKAKVTVPAVPVPVPVPQ
jgi:hypothetical protein